MSKIDELIEELCPEGVESLSLGEFVEVIGGFAFPSSGFNSHGQGLRVIRIGDLNSDRSRIFWAGEYPASSLVENGSLLVSLSGDINVLTWSSEEALLNQRVAKLVLKHDKCLSRFLFHLLKLKLRELTSDTSKSVVANLSISSLKSFRVPLPPLDVQREIVSILDKFTQLEAELEAELEARKIQYEVTRDRLLDFEGDLSQHPMSNLILELAHRGVPERPIGGFADCLSGATPAIGNESFWVNGTIPWMSSGEVNKRVVFDTDKRITELGFDSCSTKLVPANSVVIALAGQGKTRGMVAITRIELCTNQSLCSIICDDSVIPEYLLHVLSSRYRELRSISSGDGGRGGLNLQLVRAYSVPVPPLPVQEAVVFALDRLDALVNDISSGLPAEIAARRKQYEYYRNKLLTFKELDAA